MFSDCTGAGGIRLKSTWEEEYSRSKFRDGFDIAIRGNLVPVPEFEDAGTSANRCRAEIREYKHLVLDNATER